MEKQKNQLQISVSNDGFVDNGDGLVTFPQGLTITDNSTQRNGTSYDIPSMDLSTYGNQLTGDHVDTLGNLIGKTIGVTKQGNRVAVSGIQYAVSQNPYARLAYNLLVGGFSNSFSIETIGTPPDPTTGVYYNAELCGLSQVVLPNNYNAKLNQFNEIVHNSLERSKSDGLDTTGIEVILNKAIKSALPLGTATSWDSGAADKNVTIYASDSDGNIDFTKYRKAFFWVDPTKQNTKGGYKLPFADVEDGNLVAEWPGVAAAMGALNGSQGGVDIPDADRQGVYDAIAYYYKKFKKDIPDLSKNSVEDKTVEEESMTKETKKNSVEDETAEIEATNPVVEEEVVETPVVEAEAEKTEVEAEKEETPEKEVEAEKEEAVVAEPEKEKEETEEEDAKESKDAEESEKTEKSGDAEVAEEAPAENASDNKNNKEIEMTKEELAEVIANALKPVQDEIAAVKAEAKNALDAAAKEPEFHPAEKEVAANNYDDMTPEELFGKQLNAAVAAERMGSVEGRKTLQEINARNLNALKEAKLVKNSMSLEDLGNFVIAPELYNEIATVRNNYTALLNVTTWKETNSIEFGWLTRSSDIDMQSVPIGISGDDGDRLKPVSQTGYGANTDKLEEMAAVTPISINVIKFAAADILSDVAEGYSNDYDRKRAQLVVARLQQAADANGQVQTFDISNGLLGWAQTVALAADATSTGTLVFNNKTKAMLIGQAVSTFNSAILTEIGQGTLFGTPFVTVPSDLLPTLNTTETKSFLVHGQAVTITYAVFYAQLDTFTGRTSGGLQYDVDGSASYEIDGTVYSAYQRNEVVLRGSFFRGGVVKDTRLVAAITGAAVS